MQEGVVQTLISNALVVLIVAGWVVLLAAGLEPDKPLSGGIPGHIDPSSRGTATKEGLLGRIGEVAAWVVFGTVSLSLVAVVLWILRAHG